MRTLRLCVISGICAASLGCVKGNPNFGVLDQNAIPQPLFSGQKTESLITASATQTFSISGECDQKIKTLLAQSSSGAVQISSIDSIAASGITVDCSGSGRFSFTLKSLQDLGFNIVNGSTYDIQLRGMTDAGISNPSVIHITYSTTGGLGPKRVLLTSGGTESSVGSPRLASGSTFKAVVRIDHRLNDAPAGTNAPPVKSGSAFTMKSGAAAESD